LQDNDPGVRVQAVGVIGFLKMEEAIPALKAATKDAAAHVRRAAVSALAFSEMQTAADAVTHALGDQDWMVREIAADTLGKMDAGAGAADRLRAAVDDEFWQVRLKAVRSLGHHRISASVEGIAGCLQHEQANLRKEAASALGEIGDSRALPMLDAVIDDPDPDVRKNVRWAVKRLSEGAAATR
jgi:HEAT repeat protein